MKEYIVPTQNHADPPTYLAPNTTKPVWVDQKMNCDQCKYNDQDVDTFPCAKCHTRA